MKLFDYDDEDVQSIYNYAKELEGMTFRDILNEYEASPLKEYINPKHRNGFRVKETTTQYVVNNNRKGEVGNLLENYYFGYKSNSKQDADFDKVGMELKQTCLNQKKNGEYTAGERLSITNIAYDKPVEPDFYKSHVWSKIKKILLVHYLRDKTKERLDYIIKFVSIYEPPIEDLEIIISDYNIIIDKIKSGRAHELSESDTIYLGACTKGATAASSLRKQYYGDSGIEAKKRNFCFKRSYMDYVLQTYVLQKPDDTENVIDSSALTRNMCFEEIILSKLEKYYEKSDKELSKKFNVKENKDLWAIIVYRILGIKGNKAREFVKANIKIKAIRVEEDGNVRESMPLPNFKFKELVEETWETSTLNAILSETKYLMVFFYKKDDDYILKKSVFWNMPNMDLEIVKNEWESAVETVRKGVEFEVTSTGIVKNNLLAYKDTEIIHIRPHTAKSAYRLKCGFEKGDLKYADELPNGEMMTKQSFWINKKYLIKQFNLK